MAVLKAAKTEVGHQTFRPFRVTLHFLNHQSTSQLPSLSSQHSFLGTSFLLKVYNMYWPIEEGDFDPISIQDPLKSDYLDAEGET